MKMFLFTVDDQIPDENNECPTFAFYQPPITGYCISFHTGLADNINYGYVDIIQS